MKYKSLKRSFPRGFSLVELLVVIAVIAIIAAIAIPNIANVGKQANFAKDQRNAQNIASVASAAIAAGYEPSPAWITAQDVYDDLSAGVTLPSGANPMQFGISTMSPGEQTESLKFLTVTPATTSPKIPPLVSYNPATATIPEAATPAPTP